MAAALAIVSGCTSGQPDPEPTFSVMPTAPSSGWPTEVAPLPTESGVVVDEDTGETYGPADTPEWDEESRAAAEQAATDVLEAFADTDRDRDAWWADVEEHFTQLAAQDYAYVDPANVPVRKVTGEAEITEGASPYVAQVRVPTDIGPYTVTVVREDASSPWLTDRLTPPGE